VAGSEYRVKVTGLRELDRAFADYERGVKREFRKELRVGAEPIRMRAESLALGNIANIGGVWSRMKIGVTARSVYLAPVARRSIGPPRKNLAGLLLRQSMLPALEEGAAPLVESVDRWLDRLAIRNGF